MKSSAVERYLRQLDRELRRHRAMDHRLVEEVREHLVDAVQIAVDRGLSVDAAEREAFRRFGSPEVVAAAVAAGSTRMKHRLRQFLTRITSALRGRPQQGAHYHDVPAASSWHFAIRLKRPWRLRPMSVEDRKAWVDRLRQRGVDVSLFEADPRERLVRFLQDFCRRQFDADDGLESLVLLEETSGRKKRGGRYLACFSNGTQMVWTVVLTDDGGVTFDGGLAWSD